MCGILAVFDRKRKPLKEDIKLGLDQIEHRGPDATTIWQSANGVIILGHNRLSFVDLTTGDQPVVNESGTIRAVVNGEFYGFEEVRADLQSRGHRFRSQSDSEILVHLYEEFGTNCLHHLRGEFAFVLWDEAEQMVFAGRDRFGIKPLFYAHVEGRLSFASEVKALHAAGVRCAWNQRAFLQTLTIGATIGASTLFLDVKNVPPGHFVVARRDEVRVQRYWDFDFPAEAEITVRSDQEYAEQFRAVLADAVRVRMRADVPLACYLSGGLDSCSILALMSEQSPGPVRAFTLGFDQPGYDETPLAQDMAHHAGADLSLIPVNNRILADSFSDSLWYAERLFFNAHGVGKFLLSRAVHEAGYKGVLTGEGADEILAGYAHFRLDALRHSGSDEMVDREKAIATANPVSHLLLMTSSYAAPVPSLMERVGYVPAFTEPWIVNCQRLGNVLPAFFDIDREYTTWLDDMDIATQISGRHVVNQSLYMWNKTALPGYMLTVLGDRMEMAHSVEGRVPFLDHHLVEFTRSLPVRQKINGTTEKFVLREAMRSSLTPDVYQRQKHPFTAPPMLLDLDGPLFGMLQDNLRGANLSRIPYLKKDELVKTLDRLPSMSQAERMTWEVPLTGILSSCLLAERFSL